MAELDSPHLDVILRATADQASVIIVCGGVAYEGVISSFYGGTIEAVVRVCGDPSVTTLAKRYGARFKRNFQLDELDDVARIEQEDPSQDRETEGTEVNSDAMLRRTTRDLLSLSQVGSGWSADIIARQLRAAEDRLLQGLITKGETNGR